MVCSERIKICDYEGNQEKWRLRILRRKDRKRLGGLIFYIFISNLYNDFILCVPAA